MPTTWNNMKRASVNLGSASFCRFATILDKVMVRLPGELVAGYELKGAISYFADDAGLNTIKTHLEALLRTIPEESMRLQFRFEVTEDLGNLLQRYQDSSKDERRGHAGHGPTPVRHVATEGIGRRVSAADDAPVPHLGPGETSPGTGHLGQNGEAEQYGGGFGLSSRKIVQRTLKQHVDLVSEFESLLERYRVGDGRGGTRSAADGRRGPVSRDQAGAGSPYGLTDFRCGSTHTPSATSALASSARLPASLDRRKTTSTSTGCCGASSR